MKRFSVILALLLAGCATQPQTPEQQRCSLIMSQALLQPTYGGNAAAAYSNAASAMMAAGCPL